jgi:predicted transcriptional regulator
MEVHFSPDIQAKLEQVARESGCRSEEVIEDALTGYFDEMRYTREMLDRRYDDLESGSVLPIDGEAFFEQLRVREEELLRKPMAR